MACGMTSNHDCSHLRLSFFIIYSVRKIGNLVRNMSCLKCRVLFRPVHVRFQCGFSEVKKEKSIPCDISIKNIIWWASHLIIWILTFQWVVGVIYCSFSHGFVLWSTVLRTSILHLEMWYLVFQVGTEYRNSVYWHFRHWAIMGDYVIWP